MPATARVMISLTCGALAVSAGATGAAFAAPIATTRRTALGSAAARPRLTALSAFDGGGAAIAFRDGAVWAGDTPLISDVSWNIMPNERWALLGANGCGKSTLLRAITGDGRLEEGDLYIDPKLRVGCLEQTAVSGSDSSVRDEVMSRMSAFQDAQTELAAAEAGCLTGEECELERLQEAVDGFEAAGGYTAEARVASVLKGLGFAEAEYDRPCSSFSGGWQMRIGLARLLLSEPELLLLDEPTNHLDASARSWLGKYVGAYEGTVVSVSHDKEFVAAASNSIADVAGGKIEFFKSTTYPKYLVEKEERQLRAQAAVDAMERDRAKMQDFVDRMGAKASKAKQAKDRMGKLEKLEGQMSAGKSAVVQARRKPKLKLAAPPPCGKTPVELKGAAFGYSKKTPPIVDGADVKIERGMRLIVRGPNGAGKSTLLRALSGALDLHAGERACDDRLQLGFFAQDLAQELPGDALAVDYVTQTARQYDATISDERARSVMGSLGLVGPKAMRKISTLSGGEKGRVALATFCLVPSNVLLLDEPTNHLDVECIASLLDAIGEYEGAVVVVSHDRAFCEAIDCTHVGYVAGGEVKVEGRALSESDWSTEDTGVVNGAEDTAAAPPEPEAVDDAATASAKQTVEDLKQRAGAAPSRIKRIMRDVDKLESEVAALDAQMQAAGSDAAACLDLSVTRDTKQAKCDKVMAEWSELEAIVEAYEAALLAAGAVVG